jgi:two-component system, OmpR family, alkaline phosphatase synthesis response regulator PhoP
VKIAIIEDDPNIRELIKIVVADLHLPVDEYDNGWVGLDAVQKGDYSLLILDLMLPGTNGLEICRKIRQTNTTLPILMLTSKSEDDDKIQGLDMGADDYLTKPFANGELLARVKALLRRSTSQHKSFDQVHQVIRIGELALSLHDQLLTVNNHEVILTAKEFELLKLFMTNPGRTYSRTDILEAVWGEHYDGLEHTVNSNINRLRNKIELDPSQPKYLITVWGIGYKIVNQ